MYRVILSELGSFFFGEEPAHKFHNCISPFQQAIIAFRPTDVIEHKKRVYI